MTLLDVREAAKRLGIGRSSVYALVTDGLLVAHRVGTGRGVIRIAEADLADYLRRCRKSPGGSPTPRYRLVSLAK